MYGNKIHNYGDEFNDGGGNGIVGGLEDLRIMRTHGLNCFIVGEISMNKFPLPLLSESCSFSMKLQKEVRRGEQE